MAKRRRGSDKALLSLITAIIELYFILFKFCIVIFINIIKFLIIALKYLILVSVHFYNKYWIENKPLSREEFIKVKISRMKGQFYPLTEKKNVTLEYKDRKSEITKRNIVIEGIFFRRDSVERYGHIFIMAYCKLRNEFRIFDGLGVIELIDENGEIISGTKNYNEWFIENLLPLVENRLAKNAIKKKLEFFISLKNK